MLGFFFGLMPGRGALVAGFASYMLKKKISRSPECLGKGAIEGVAGPESANNAVAQASFITTPCLGIPANAVIGIIMGALLMQNVVPGPQILTEHPGLFWGIVASMLVGNAIMIVLKVPLIRVFVLLLRLPQAMMAPLIVLFCVIGVFSMNNSLFDAGVVIGAASLPMAAQGRLRSGSAAACLLGSLFEENLRQ